MKISRLHLSEQITSQVGLEEVKLERLGSVVALIGKNGSGKSRVLNQLEKYFQTLSYEDYFSGEIVNVPEAIEKLVNRVNSINSEIRTNTDQLNLLPDLTSQLQSLNARPGTVQSTSARQHSRELRAKISEISQNASKNNVLEIEKKTLDKKLNSEQKKYFHRIKYSEIRNLQAVLENISSEDKVLSFEELLDSVTEQEDYNELSAIYRTGLAYLAKLPNQLIDDFIDSFGDTENFEQKKSRKRFLNFSKYVDLFLNKKLTWDKKAIQKSISTDGITTVSQGLWKLNNRIFDYTELSEGERTLFTYSLLFFLLDQKTNLRLQESIILIDEPELHLHPESEFKIIEKISELVKEKGQLWIATHSISILSNLSYDEIFMVKSGKIYPPSRITPGQSFSELMGIEDHIEKLSQFITNISNWAFLNYMTQCFNDPDSIKCAQENDPEFEVFKKSIKAKDSSIILLDFGAGQGRIYREMAKDDQLAKKIQYSALEPDEKNILELKELNIPAYKSYSDLPDYTFDFILLCNVLHEISVSEWEIILNKIKSSLKDDGFLIIIEDLKLPKGEKINEAGFIIMDEASLVRLFSLTKTPLRLFPDEDKYKDRILCNVIAKPLMGTITSGSIIESLVILKENTFKKIKNIRNTEVTPENKLSLGRESAFYSQLYINSLFGIEIMSEINSLFKKVETEASFKGGEETWKKYLNDNLNPNTPVNNGAPIGIYQVYVQFVVDADGNISEVKPITNHGYGMEEEAIRVIKNGPKWNPAIQNGQRVKAYRKQPITFHVEQE